MKDFIEIKNKECVKTGKILHLDGDKRYSEKAYKHYKKTNVDAIIKNIEEKKQPIMIKSLLEEYNPDILVITRTR